MELEVGGPTITMIAGRSESYRQQNAFFLSGGIGTGVDIRFVCFFSERVVSTALENSFDIRISRCPFGRSKKLRPRWKRDGSKSGDL